MDHLVHVVHADRVELGIEAGQALARAVLVQGGHERRAVAVVQEQHQRVGVAVVGEDRVGTALTPQVQRVLRAAALARVGVVLGLHRAVALEAVDVAVGAAVEHRRRGVDVAGERLGEVRQALVHPGRLERVGVVVQQVLPLVGERALVEVRARRPARAQVRRRFVHRVGARAVLPVERVDRHHVAVEKLVDLRREEPGDVGRRRRERVVVVVAHVVDQRHRAVAGAGVVAAVAARVGTEQGVGPVTVRRRAEGGRLLRVDVRVELGDEVARLLVGDRGGAGDLRPAVTGREGQVVGHPHLDVHTDGAQRVGLAVVGAIGIVEREPLAVRADRRRLGGGEGTPRARLVRLRRADRLAGERDPVEVRLADVARLVGGRRR